MIVLRVNLQSPLQRLFLECTVKHLCSWVEEICCFSGLESRPPFWDNSTLRPIAMCIRRRWVCWRLSQSVCLIPLTSVTGSEKGRWSTPATEGQWSHTLRLWFPFSCLWKEVTQELPSSTKRELIWKKSLIWNQENGPPLHLEILLLFCYLSQRVLP